MPRKRVETRAVVAAAAGAVLVFSSARPAQAVPAFATQTGQPCVACHIGAFGPQLTPMGRAFKIGGYTQTGGDGLASQIPIAVMALGSFTNTAAGVPRDQRERGYATNDNFNLDQISVFIAGGFGEHSGAFMQLTGANNLKDFSIDNTDIRPFTTEFDVGDTTLRVGVSLNNGPTVDDPYNTTYVWGYPYAQSALAPTPAAGPAIEGLIGNALGATVYLWYDRSLYIDVGAYSTQSPWLLARTGNTFGPGSMQGAAPYVRAAYQWEWNDQVAHVGALFMQSNVNPTVADRQTDNTFGRDRYNDYAIDASYAWLGSGTHIGTVQGIYTHESQDIAGTVNSYNTANGTTLGNNYHLDQIRLNASYWYQNTYGATLGWERTWGPANPAVFSAAPVDGSANGKPNSNAFIAEVDWVPFGKADSWMGPFVNLKVGAQYIAYTQFNGGNSNYDGYGRKASDNNTFYMFAWMAF